MNRTRCIRCPSIINMRDLGGLPVKDGRYTRYGLVFRSANFLSLSSTDALWLRHTKGIRTFIDVRTIKEVERDGRPGALLMTGINYISAPIEERHHSFRNIRNPEPRDYLNSYCQMVPHISLALQTLVTVLTCDDMLPLVFGCTAGKDRTGVLTSLLLSYIDVSDKSIAADYALSARFLRPNIECFHAHWERKGLSPLQYARRLETRPETMKSFLAWCRMSYGSIPALFSSLHIDPSMKILLSQRLIALLAFS